RASRRPRPRLRHPGARGRGGDVSERRLLLPRVDGGLARTLGERRRHLSPAPRRRDAREARRGWTGAPRGARRARRPTGFHHGGERTMIRFVGLKKEYGTTVAVDQLDFSIEDGQVFGFIGPNGAGKTTTIKMMMGLLAPSAGTVLLGGHDIAREPEAAKAITGYLADHPFLYDKLTANEFLRFVGGLYGLAGAELAQRSAELLAQFQLADREIGRAHV